jgi:hypothetical protein
LTVELEFLHYRPRAGEVVAAAYEEAITEGRAPAALFGYWTVDVGPLNVAAALWTLPDGASTDDSQGSSTVDPWPPALEGTIDSIDSLLLEPAPFNEVFEPGTYGGIYEIRIYDYELGSVGTVVERWAEMVEVRRAISPLIGCFSGSDGIVDKWVHIWAYEDGLARERARVEAARGGKWPPNTGEWLVHQENMIVLPSKFSPLH